MINLLPDEQKRDIRAARTNVILARYNLITALAVALLLAFCWLFYVLLQANQQKALALSNDNNQRAAALGDVRAAADTYRKNLTTANQVLSSSVSYTDIIIAITKLVPKDVILDNLSLSPASLTQPTQFQAHATNYDTAEQLKRNFQSSKLFKNVFFVTLTASPPGSSGASRYAVSITMSAQLDPKGLGQ